MQNSSTRLKYELPLINESSGKSARLKSIKVEIPVNSMQQEYLSCAVFASGHEDTQSHQLQYPCSVAMRSSITCAIFFYSLTQVAAQGLVHVKADSEPDVHCKESTRSCFMQRILPVSQNSVCH